jgi:site-specific recombinase XerD
MPGYPSKANHLLRYLRRLFPWGMRHGHCKTNPADGAKRVKERKRHGMPVQSSYATILKFAEARGALKSHTKGSLSPLLWPLMEIKYLCRMRTVEVVALTDAHASEQGLYIARRKRSNDNIVKWSQRLRAAWDAALAVREEMLSRKSNAARPFPVEPERRHIFWSEACTPMTVSGLDSIWGYLMRAAIEAEVIKPSQRFTLHGLKHRGVTDTKGSRRSKQRADIRPKKWSRCMTTTCLSFSQRRRVRRRVLGRQRFLRTTRVLSRRI